jgi:hypothetical protein
MDKTRYQVLSDDGEIQNFVTKKEVNAHARKLRREGKKNVSVWDCYDNPLSRLMGL